MSELGDKQKLFVACLAKFLTYAIERGYSFSLGEGFIYKARPGKKKLGVTEPTMVFLDQKHMHTKDGTPTSVHYVGLAQDLNLFVKGEYITNSDHPVWIELGEYWESLDKEARWGGRFDDGNHLSIEYQGRK